MSAPPWVPPGLRRLHALATRHREGRFAVKYAIVGVANVAIDLGVYVALVHVSVWYVAAKTLSLCASTINGYVFNRRWTFRAGDHENMKLVRYVAVQGTGLLVNLALLTLLVAVLGAGKVFAAVVAVPFVAAYCFLGNRLWTFRRHIAPAVV